MNTHFVPYDAHDQALCGEVVGQPLHDTAPTCPDCRVILDRETRSLEAFDPPIPADLVAAAATSEAIAEFLAPARKALAPRDVIPFARRGGAIGAAVALVDQLATATAALTVVEQAADLAALALALEVTDMATCVYGEQLYADLGTAEDGIHKEYDKGCALAHAAWKNQTDKRSSALKPVEEARKALGPRVAEFRAKVKAEEARVTREAEEAARRESEATARREAAALEEQAAEERRVAAEATKAAECAETLTERLHAGATAHEARERAAGLEEAAVTVVEDAKHAPLPVVAARPSSLSTSTVNDKKNWIAEINDWPTMRKAIGEGKYPEFDEAIQAVVLPILNKQAPTLKATLGTRYPGAEGRQKASLARK